MGEDAPWAVHGAPKGQPERKGSSKTRVIPRLCTLHIDPSQKLATLKDITRRLKSIKNIQKITKSMKMVAAAKYARAERELKPARVYGVGSLALYES
ncbi:ATP synthase subunit gamma, mitochondrial-like isoform X1 [Dromiciops gliroides]|uniref:ATP synthase subunit gamma, mitochondrial-like isoform X1 n=1 Tax=Dromiciops gliroides TaxID=33562 RepID=UPI001CC469B1|nr:ATP synthase subunit gamma, mitochondrial-like isoform X1 [Dromiciops gliroides]